MPDLLDRIREELNSRLAELRSAVDEHQRLDSALLALGEAGDKAPARAVTNDTKSPAPRTRGPRAAPAPRTRGQRAARKNTQRKKTQAKQRKRAPRGANRQAVMRAVQDRPGATSAELATVSGVGRNTLYTLLARLVKEGALQTRDLPTGRTGYALAGPPPALKG